MGFYNIINSLFKNIFATLKIIRKLLFMIIFVVIIVFLLENTCFASTNSKTIEITNFEQGTITFADGANRPSNNVIRTDFINLPEGDYTLNYYGAHQAFGFLYNLNGSFNKILFDWTSGEVNFHLDGNCLVRFCFKYFTGDITPSDISNVSLLYTNSDPNVDYNESLDIINSNISNGFNVIDNTLTNANINFSPDFPSMVINDTTSAGFNNIFAKIYRVLTTPSFGDTVSFTIPYVNKSFEVGFYTLFGDFNYKLITPYTNAFWFFIVCLYIVKDIYKQINKLKSGNIDNVCNENVRSDIL